MPSRRITIQILGEDKGASRALRGIAQDADKSNKHMEGFTSGFAEAGAKMSKVLTIGGAVGPAILAVGSAASAATAGVTALGGAIGPGIAAGAAVGVGAMLAIKQATAVSTFAFTGLSAAIEGQKGAMKALSPEGRAFAKVLKGLKPEVESVRTSVQKGMFPGLTDATNRLAKTYFPLLRRAARQTGTELGALAKSASLMADSGPWRKDFATITKKNSVNIGLFGQAGIYLADAARSLLATSMPVVRMFAQWAGGAARSVDAFVQAKRASGELAAFWKGAATNGALLGHILGNLAGGLFQIFKIGGGGQGKSMLTNLEGMTAQFEAWTHSSGGIRAISQWFDQGRANLSAMGRLLKSVTKGLSGMGSGKQLAPLIDQINKQIIPPLMRFLHNASASGALGALVDAVGKLIGVFADLEENDGSVKAFAVTLGKLADAAGWVVDNVPGASKALGVLFTVMGTKAALSFVGLGGVVDGIAGGLVKMIKPAEEAGKAASLAGEGAKSAGIFSRAWAGAQALLNAALDANPIGIIVLAIAALAAGLIYAYKHSEKFRDIVNGVFKAVGDAAKFLWTNVIRPYFHYIIDLWFAVAGALVNGAAKAFGWVPGLGPKLRKAADWFNDFKQKVNDALDGVHDKKVKISAPGADHTIGQLKTLNNLLSVIDNKKQANVNVTTPGMFDPGSTKPRKHHATGTSSAPGGWSWVGERGPELLNLRPGSTVLNNRKSMAATAAGGVTINFNGLVTDPKAAAREVRKILLDLQTSTGQPLGFRG